MRIKFFILLLISIVFSSCITSEPSDEITQFGDEAEISFKNKDDIEGELLFVTDSSFFIKSKNVAIITEISFKKSSEIKINGYSNNNWILTLMLLEALPATLFAVEISANTSSSFPWYLFIFPAINYLVYELGTAPAPGIEPGEVNKYTAEKLKKYSRFPMGLSPEQFKEVSKNKIVNQIF